MSDTTNQLPELDALRTHLSSLARDEQHLHAQLLSAGEHVAQRESDLQNALGDLRANLAPQKAAPRQAPTEGQRVANKYLAYQQLVGRIREIVHNTVPPTAILLVVSRGDEDLVKLDGRTTWHFPRSADGTYAGYYPKDSAAAIEHLESLRAAGAEYLVFPQTAFWWLDHYADFNQHLEQNYHLAAKREETCLIFALDVPALKTKPKPRPTRRRVEHSGRTMPAPKNGNGRHKV